MADSRAAMAPNTTTCRLLADPRATRHSTMRRAAWKSGACRWLSPQQVPETGRGAYLLAAVFLLFLLAVLSFTEAPPAGADESTARIKHMTVSLFPEYDEPQVLVTYRGE